MISKLCAFQFFPIQVRGEESDQIYIYFPNQGCQVDLSCSLQLKTIVNDFQFNPYNDYPGLYYMLAKQPLLTVQIFRMQASHFFRACSEKLPFKHNTGQTGLTEFSTRNLKEGLIHCGTLDTLYWIYHEILVDF